MRESSQDRQNRAVTVNNLRQLLKSLIASNGVAVQLLPDSTSTAFLSYTDFLACYVGFLHRLHSQSNA